MKKNKKIVITIAIVLIAALVAVAVILFPKAKTGSEIAALLKPIITAENQSMDMNVRFQIDGKEADIHTKMYFLTEDNKKYLVTEQDGHSAYIVDNVLYLENGHAFLISDSEADTSVRSVDISMFAQIAALYEALEITASKEEDTEVYTIEVSGEDAKALIQHVIPDIYKELSELDSLKVEITAKENVLTSVSYYGGATVNGKEMELKVCAEHFTFLEDGEYKIPEEIKTAASNVDKGSLFCITKDLYRLMMAFADLSSQENTDGKVIISANGGWISFKKSYDLAELKNHTSDYENAEELEKLPELIALLCTEGEISCTEETDGFHYVLTLDKKTMGQIADNVLPGSLTEVIKLSRGNVEIIVDGNKINSIDIGIAGSIQSLFSKVQSQVGIEFIFN